MYFRFASAVALVVLVSLAGIALEKRNLELRRSISRQHFQMDVLYNAHSRLRLKTQELGAPVRLLEPFEDGRLQLQQAEQPSQSERSDFPVLRWRRPLRHAW